MNSTILSLILNNTSENPNGAHSPGDGESSYPANNSQSIVRTRRISNIPLDQFQQANSTAQRLSVSNGNATRNTSLPININLSSANEINSANNISSAENAKMNPILMALNNAKGCNNNSYNNFSTGGAMSFNNSMNSMNNNNSSSSNQLSLLRSNICNNNNNILLSFYDEKDNEENTENEDFDDDGFSSMSSYKTNLGLGFSHDKTVANSTPMFMIKAKPIAAMSFEEVCIDPHIVLNPSRLGFIPAAVWMNDTVSFGHLVTNFFRRRNSATSKFPHKLYNALKISECYPDFIKHIGIQWITYDIFKVDRVAFARLLGVKSIEGGLFHQQGNFPSHGFMELSFQESEEIALQFGLGRVDLSEIRFMKSINGTFTKASKEGDIKDFRWSSKPMDL